MRVAGSILPADYYRRIHEVEEAHWWHVGMRAISAALLGERLRRPAQHVLDAGCGTGGFLAWLRGEQRFGRLCGADISEEAIQLARTRVPEAELHVAPLHRLPFEDASFDLVVTNDVLQHVPDEDVQASLGELRRVLRRDGTLLVRTNGARRARRERDDWRVYDADMLSGALTGAGFHCERLTYANVVPSLWAALRGRRPVAPTDARHGIPTPDGGGRRGVAGRLVKLESRYLARPGRRLPYGHTLFALARPAEVASGRPRDLNVTT